MTRTITLLLLAAVLFVQCKKGKPIKKEPLFSKIGGKRNWHRSHFYEASGMHFPTPIHEDWMLPDTTYTITLLNDSTIQFFNGEYKYDKTDSTLKVHYFGGGYYFFTYLLGGGLAYFYEKDSVAWGQIDRHGTNDYWLRDDRWYTY